MGLNIVRKVRRKVAKKVLSIKRKKLNNRYYGLLPNEARLVRSFERRRKNRELPTIEAREKRRIEEKKIPFLQKELEQMTNYKRLLHIFSEKKLSLTCSEIISTEIKMAEFEIKTIQKNLKKLKLDASTERKKAEALANKIAGKK